MKKAFFFDRDGVLNASIYRYEAEYNKMMNCAPVKLSELKINDDAKDVIDYVKSQGYIPIIITNQPDFLKKDILLKDYEEITSKICKHLDLKRSQIFECLHKKGFSLECDCKKPKPGLILMAKGMHNIDIGKSWVIGDSFKDIMAGHNANIKNLIFLKNKSPNSNSEEYNKVINSSIKVKFINDILEIKNII